MKSTQLIKGTPSNGVSTMSTNRHVVADKLARYLYHTTSLRELVDWAESAMMEAEFDEKHYDTTRSVWCCRRRSR